MSVLISEPPRVAEPVPGIDVAAAQRIVDVPTRLHAWSLPVPCCVHGSPLDRHCYGCDGVDPDSVKTA